jgi:hypothetical protein
MLISRMVHVNPSFITSGATELVGALFFYMNNLLFETSKLITNY